MSSVWWIHPPPYASVIKEISCKNHINPTAVAAIIKKESGFNKNALVREAKVHDWSVGLMQIRIDTAKALGFIKKDFLLFTPKVNIYYGVLYLKIQEKRFGRRGRIYNVISSYNAGSPTLKNKKYVRAVMNNWKHLSKGG